VKGKAAAVVQDATADQRLLDIAARADVEEGIRQGLPTLPADVHTRRAKHLTPSAGDMACRVELGHRAARDLELLFPEKNATDKAAAARWFNWLERAVYALEKHPFRCPVRPEGRKMTQKLFHLLYGSEQHVYRVIYEIDEQRRTVWVLTSWYTREATAIALRLVHLNPSAGFAEHNAQMQVNDPGHPDDF